MLHAYFFLQTTHQVLFAQKEGRGRVPVSLFFFFCFDTCLDARCLKTTEKVSFNIASEASYAYILSEQKTILASF